MCRVNSDNNNNDNSIQFNSLLFMCRVNSHKAVNNNNNNNNNNNKSYYYYGSKVLYSALANVSLSSSYTQSIGRLGWISARRNVSTHRATQTYRHPCLEWDSNTRPQ
jgi:hypothetical protein